MVIQSTQEAGKIPSIRDALAKKIKHLRFFNTICAPTKIKQQEIRTLPKENDLIIVIGSRKSANTKRLFQIAKEINKNTYWINNKKQIKREWLIDVKTVGLTAGASTPYENIKQIIKQVKLLS